MMDGEWIAWVVGGYLAGSIPVGYLWVRFARGVDVRRHGSGNIGATNVARVTGSRAAGTAVFLLDALKGWGPVAVFLRSAPAPHPALPFLIGAAAFAGHCWPAWLGFRGGKGVATGLGAVAALFPLAAALSFLVWLAAAAAARYVSAASVLAAASLPVWIALGWWGRAPGPEEPRWALVFAALCAGAVVLRHAPNLRRLAAGTEPRIGARRGDSGGPA